MAQIATVMIPCTVVQMNNQQFFNADAGTIGAIENIPCRNVFVDEVLYWCSPVKDYGLFDALEFRLVDTANPIGTPPTFDSFIVQRIRDKISGTTWWVYVENANNFLNSCATCCGDAAVPMPTPDPYFIAPCQIICAQNDDGDLEAVYGIPTPGSAGFIAVASFDDTVLPTGDPVADVNALVSFANSNWSSLGTSSPPATATWSSPDDLTLVATLSDDAEGHSLCVGIYPTD